MKKLLTLAIATLAMTAHANTANNNPINYNLINFSANASQKVENDQVNATMTKTLQNKSNVELAKRITETLNQANIIAKKYPNVKVATGNQNTYPQYDKNQKIIGWQGNASLNLQSNDTVATSQLIAELQNIMQLDGLDFSVSEAKQKTVNQALMSEASKNFQQQAQNLLPAWNAKGYQLVSLDFNEVGGYQRYSKSYALAMPQMAVVDASMPSQDFQTGESTITVTANGVIQLIK